MRRPSFRTRARRRRANLLEKVALRIAAALWLVRTLVRYGLAGR